MPLQILAVSLVERRKRRRPHLYKFIFGLFFQYLVARHNGRLVRSSIESICGGINIGKVLDKFDRDS